MGLAGAATLANASLGCPVASAASGRARGATPDAAATPTVQENSGISTFIVESKPLTASDVGAYSRVDVDDAIEAAKNGPLLAAPTIASPKIVSEAAPANSNSPGTVGQIEWDANFIYICIETNNWKRAPLSAW